MSNTEVYDVVIVGGGAVGLLTALYLEKKCALKIALIEKRSLTKFPTQKPFTQQIALSVKSKQILEEIDCYHPLLSISTPLKDIHVSVKGRFGQLRMYPQRFGLEKFADVVSLYDFEQILLQKLKNTKNCQIFDEAQVSQIDFNHQCPKIVYHQAGEVKEVIAQLLIGCDGAHSSIKTLLNIPSQYQEHSQEALVGQIQLKTHHGSKAFERFLENGALAILPGQGQKVTFILTLPTEEITSLFDDDQAILAQLQELFGYRLGHFDKLLVKRRYALNTSMAYGQIQQSVLLMGNAAHQLQPMAAQGLNLSIRDIEALALAITWGRAKQKKLNDYTILQQYLHFTREDQNRTHVLIKALSKGMAQNKWPMFVKSTLLNLMEICSPVKHQLTEQFMGVGREHV